MTGTFASAPIILSSAHSLNLRDLRLIGGLLCVVNEDALTAPHYAGPWRFPQYEQHRRGSGEALVVHRKGISAWQLSRTITGEITAICP